MESVLINSFHQHLLCSSNLPLGKVLGESGGSSDTLAAKLRTSPAKPPLTVLLTKIRISYAFRIPKERQQDFPPEKKKLALPTQPASKPEQALRYAPRFVSSTSL
ncbi:hypothetical protein Salat_1158700 [Sesamum alatum]|uniref:Uncharacterized protein n=1 Tax=Sesamum alatum TaxID=300844 RepID=A0AAE1YE83_9LAMI|nr:hypothetical protein Salat_1158700 [Sesamum alatum]